MAGRRYGLIVSSFALHLLEESRLPQLLYQLGTIAPDLIVLTPHKRPYVREDWGWCMEDEMIEVRVRMRRHRSLLFEQE